MQQTQHVLTQIFSFYESGRGKSQVKKNICTENVCLSLDHPEKITFPKNFKARTKTCQTMTYMFIN